MFQAIQGHYERCIWLDKLDLFWLFLVSGAHSLELSIVGDSWLMLACKFKDLMKLVRWLGPGNLCSGQNKLLFVATLKAPKAVRFTLFDRLQNDKNLDNFFASYDKTLFFGDCCLYDKLQSEQPHEYVSQLSEHMFAWAEERLIRYITRRVHPAKQSQVAGLVGANKKNRALALVLSNWSFLKHPLLKRVHMLACDETKPFYLFTQVQQFYDPSFFC